jgi:LytS/YehU family sensor histidine kinase
LAYLFSSSPEYVDLLWGAIAWRYGNGFLFYIILIVVYYLYANYIRQQERNERENKLRSTLQNAEIDLLRSRLNPHFLFNSLNSLNALIQTEPENASKMLLQLSDFLRFSIEKDKQEKIDLKEELENLERYMSIEQVRFGDRLKFSRKIKDEALLLKLPAMLLQPLLENAIKYGLGSKLDDVNIKIEARVSKGNLLLEVENMYDSQVSVGKGSGQGIDNVCKRLEMIYKKTADFRVEKTDRLFQVKILIPQE